MVTFDIYRTLIVRSIIFYFIFFIKISFAQNADPTTASRHQEMMDLLYTQPKYPVQNIGILLYDGYQTLDAMGPYEVLSNLMGVKVFFVAKEKGPIRNQRGMTLAVDHSIHDVNKLDILIIPGGAAETFLMTRDTVVLNWIRKIDRQSVYTASVCTGAWILGATGLLKDRKVSTNWYRAEERMKTYGATYLPERWVKDGKYWTSAGVTAGLDMSLAIINELYGSRYTQGTMLNLEYDPQPPVQGGSLQKTDPLVSEMMQTMYDMYLLPLFNQSITR
jgi:transcriptional regulator GlxA family with amidase domain